MLELSYVTPAKGNPHFYSFFFVGLQFNTERIIGWNYIKPENCQRKIAVT